MGARIVQGSGKADYLDVGAVGVVALAALGAGHEPSFLIQAKGSAHDARVLLQHEAILRRAEHQPVLQDRLAFRP